MLINCHVCEIIKKIVNWEIDLTPDNKFIEEIIIMIGIFIKKIGFK